MCFAPKHHRGAACKPRLEFTKKLKKFENPVYFEDARRKPRPLFCFVWLCVCGVWCGVCFFYLFLNVSKPCVQYSTYYKFNPYSMFM